MRHPLAGSALDAKVGSGMLHVLLQAHVPVVVAVLSLVHAKPSLELREIAGVEESLSQNVQRETTFP